MTGEAQPPAALPDDVRLAMELESVFMPHATRQRRSFYENDRYAKFVHYTSAEAALSIIKSKRIWMRNATCMADYREVQHGFDLLSEFFSDGARHGTFIGAVDECVPGAASEAMAQFGRWMDRNSTGRIQLNTYIASISEHDSKEDCDGRLSMWRGFGNNVSRVAIVLKIPWYAGGGLSSLNTIFSPVAYRTAAEVYSEIYDVIDRVRASHALLRSVERDRVVTTIFYMLLVGAACVKHRGFHEEREWRAIYTPKLWPTPLMEPSTEVVRGVPQIVYKLPLDTTVSDDLRELDLSLMLDRLIIGPSPYPWALYEAFVAELSKAGVIGADNRVFASNIPIRA
ncbi:MAG: DUF2971 domain-containing protein [Bryobacteraceae bacterium]